MALLNILKKHGGKITALTLTLALCLYMFVDDPKYVGYSPDQPIPFSHKIHAGELEINCQFCHTGVEKSQHAIIPDSATCMKCHSQVGSDSEHIQFLRESFKKGEPIRWTKVYDLPDHVRFSHKPHIARGMDCTECHGDVKSMDKVRIADNAKFTMGWCVSCHRQKTEELNLQPKFPAGDHGLYSQSVRLTDCSTCHY